MAKKRNDRWRKTSTHEETASMTDPE
eukprot:COSAG02_NODE_9042_length_2353_cov_1.321207_5_plen_25_part_01